MKLLIAYATTDGMTSRIAQRMAQTLRGEGHEAEVIDTASAPAGLEPRRYDGVLLGASLHAGGFQRSAKRFVGKHLGALRWTTSGFFSVCLAIASKRPEEREAARKIARAFPSRLGWTPDVIEVIAGALAFSRYGLLRRLAMQRIARAELGGDIDASRDHVYTDWAAVDRFALAFARRAGAAREVALQGGAP